MTVRQWAARGVSRPLLRSLVYSGDLVQVRHGGYATQSAVRWAGTDPVRRHVLCLLAVRAAIGPDAVASYQSAAVLHRLDLLRSPPADYVTLTVGPARRWERAKSPSVAFHAADLPQEHRTRLYNLPVTTAARTVADLARTLPFTDAVVTADSALRQQKMTKADLAQVLSGCPRWPGVRQARRVLEFADERAESPLESAARVVFHEFGLAPPDLQTAIRTPQAAFRVDFCWPADRLVVEADGLVKYSVREDLIRQFQRDRLLRDAGYQVVHVTWDELFGMPEAVIERIRRARAARGPY